MATPPNKTTANATTQADLTAITNAANTRFIDQATQAITNAIAQGLFKVNLVTFANVDLTYIQSYFTGLGYNIVFPDDVFTQPAQLFGPLFEQFFQTPGLTGLHNPTEVIISWQ